MGIIKDLMSIRESLQVKPPVASAPPWQEYEVKWRDGIIITSDGMTGRISEDARWFKEESTGTEYHYQTERNKTVRNDMPEDYREPPDELTKPPEIIEYAFAPVCPNGHIDGFGKVAITPTEMSSFYRCKQCDGIGQYALIKRFADWKWNPQPRANYGFWSKSYEYAAYDEYQYNGNAKTVYNWTRAEFVKALPNDFIGPYTTQ
jgi:hypothetical protein